MIVAVASGKGGTGKTTVTAGLSRVWPQDLTVADLDVEAPNLHLFLAPELDGRSMAVLPVPVIDEEKCTACRACAEICQFKAVTVLGGHVLTFPEMCHGCGGCLAVCPEGAVTENRRELGEVLWGKAGRVDFVMGRLRIGEAMSPPLMRAVLDRLPPGRDALLDAPPGTSCPAMTAVSRADVIVMVTEPTPFGLHDLKLARQAFSALGKPMGVVINRAGLGDDRVAAYAAATGLPLLLEIPFDRRAAEAYAEGRVLADIDDRYRQAFADLAGVVMSLARTGREAAHA